jgi:putative spermidine/putrescine transport system permease protein
LLGSLLVLLIFSFYGFANGALTNTLTLSSWRRTLSDGFFWTILWRSVQLAGVVTLAALIIGYPTAFALSRVTNIWVLRASYVAIFSPLVISVVVRSYGWLYLLGNNGVVNSTLGSIGLPPVHLIYNVTGVEIAMVHAFLPFMVFPVLSVLRQVPQVYTEAANDLGANRLQAFTHVTVPLSLPGAIAGCQVVFVVAIASYVTPELMGGGRVIVASRLAWENVSNLDWPRGAVQVFSILVCTGILVAFSALLSRRTYLGKLPRG